MITMGGEGKHKQTHYLAGYP